MDENKEKNMNCESEGIVLPEKPSVGNIKCEVIKLDDDVPAPDDVIVIPVSEYKYLIRCEAAVNLMDKLLDKYGEYSSERAKIMSIACELLGKKEGPFDA